MSTPLPVELPKLEMLTLAELFPVGPGRGLVKDKGKNDSQIVGASVVTDAHPLTPKLGWVS